MKARASNQSSHQYLFDDVIFTLPFFETKRTVIRRLNPLDKTGFIELMTDKRVKDLFAFDDEAKTKVGATILFDELIASYDSVISSITSTIGAIYNRSTQVFIGIIGANAIEKKTIDIYCSLLPRYWRQGIGTEVLSEFSTFLFDNTGFRTITMYISKDNIAAIRIAERIGFENTGQIRIRNANNSVFLFKKNLVEKPV